MYKHSKLPWVACIGDAGKKYNIEHMGTGNDCYPMATCKGPDCQDNAQFIVTACNMHYNLLHEIERLKSIIKEHEGENE